jgi:putative transposase
VQARLHARYSLDLNSVEGVWAHVKRSLAKLAVMALDQLEALVRNRLKRHQGWPDTSTAS